MHVLPEGAARIITNQMGDARTKKGTWAGVACMYIEVGVEGEGGRGGNMNLRRWRRL